MRRAVPALVWALLLAGALAGPAHAAFGLKDVGVEFTDSSGAPSLQAGSHPFAMATTIEMNTSLIPEGESCPFEECELPEGAVEDLTVALPEGFVGDPRAVPPCSMADFIEVKGGFSACPDATAVGIQALKFSFDPVPVGAENTATPLYNLVPPPGVAARFGFVILSVPVTIDVTLNPDPPYNVIARATNIAQVALFYGSTTTLWGDPASSDHDSERGDCLGGTSSCPVDAPQPRALITSPRSCTGPLRSEFMALSWPTWALDGEGVLRPVPPATDSEVALTEPGMVNCPALGFAATVDAQPTSDQAESPSGLDFNLQIDDPGITNPAEGATARSDIKRAEVILPEGMTINPSQAEGLAVCSEADLARETLSSEFGEGCPAASKIGTVEVESPLLEGEVFKGSLFVAEPYANRFGSLLAIYQVIRHRELGLLVKLAGQVRPDPETGQLITTFDDLPQLPFSDFRLHFREGGRSPLVTPPACGTYETEAIFAPWANPANPLTVTSSFQITKGVAGGPCPAGGLPSFRPALEAGTLNPRAGAFSPFALRLHRGDGEQEFTRFAIKLPPGLAGVLAGIPKCPDAAIAAAKQRSGAAELAAPSCPPASELGHTLAGAGVGSALTYAPGKVYLAGPYHGAPVSIAAITAAVAGPFDLGTVVVRQGFKIDPRTAEVFLDPVGSDPIPHIIRGIVVHAREIRASVDRPNFVFNPTSCEPTSVASTVWGSGLDFASPADDNPLVVSSPFQAADCAALRFKPKLNLRLIGATKRGGHPKLRAFLRMPKGNANISHARVTLPSSAFLDQSHIRTVCTRVAFAQRACPPGSVYGYAKAVTPVLDAPLEGPVYLRSSENKLPDLVAALRSREGIEIELVGRVDSVKGRIRNTFDVVPDAPVDTFTLTMRGGNKGLIINSRNLCFKRKRNRARAEFDAHNGRERNWRPVVRARCKRGKARRSSHGRGERLRLTPRGGAR